jgi:O-succinylbenzoate synthase
MISLPQILDSLRVIQLPLRTRFRGITVREVALFEGESGWGEFSPFLEYGDAESVAWLRSGIEAASNNEFPRHRDAIEVNGTIPDTNNVREIEELIAKFDGVGTYKVKVGSDLASDLSRLARVRKFAPSAKLRVDVNGAWSVNEAKLNIRAMYEEFGPHLEYIEQPVASLVELKELKQELGIDIKIAVDELLRKSNEPMALDLKDAADILILKVAPLGGITRCLEILDKYKLPAVVSSALDSAPGISHGLRLAAALPDLNYASGLATGALFTEDLGEHKIKAGRIEVSSPTIEPAQLEKLQAPKERIEWWRNRIERVWELAK